MTEKNKPIGQQRIGRLKATIWSNETKNGPLYNVTFSRTYRVDVADDQKKKGDNGWRDTTSFGRDDLLLLAKLADRVHTEITERLAG